MRAWERREQGKKEWILRGLIFIVDGTLPRLYLPIHWPQPVAVATVIVKQLGSGTGSVEC